MLQAIRINSKERVEAVIAWLKSLPNERGHVRKVTVSGVYVSTGKDKNLVTQKKFAEVLEMTPNLRKLRIHDYTSSKVDPKLVKSLKALTQLESIKFVPPMLPPSKKTGRDLTMTNFFGSLAPNLTLKTIFLELTLYPAEYEQSFRWPAGVKTRHLVMQLWAGERAVPPELTDPSFLVFAAKLEALQVPGHFLSPQMLHGLSKTLRALTVDVKVSEECLQVEMPLLELVALGAKGGCEAPIRALAGSALYNHVETVIWPHCDNTPEQIKTVFEGHSGVKLVVLDVPLTQDDIEDGVREQLRIGLQAVGEALPKVKAVPYVDRERWVGYDESKVPDLLHFLETGEVREVDSRRW